MDEAVQKRAQKQQKTIIRLISIIFLESQPDVCFSVSAISCKEFQPRRGSAAQSCLTGIVQPKSKTPPAGEKNFFLFFLFFGKIFRKARY